MFNVIYSKVNNIMLNKHDKLTAYNENIVAMYGFCFRMYVLTNSIYFKTALQFV